MAENEVNKDDYRNKDGSLMTHSEIAHKGITDDIKENGFIIDKTLSKLKIVVAGMKMSLKGPQPPFEDVFKKKYKAEIKNLDKLVDFYTELNESAKLQEVETNSINKDSAEPHRTPTLDPFSTQGKRQAPTLKRNEVSMLGYALMEHRIFAGRDNTSLKNLSFGLSELTGYAQPQIYKDLKSKKGIKDFNNSTIEDLEFIGKLKQFVVDLETEIKSK